MVQWELMVAENQRFNCYPEENADEAKCTARGCIWKVRGDAHYTRDFYFLLLKTRKKQQL